MHRPLLDRVPRVGVLEPAEVLDRFLDWVADVDLTLYPAQEAALLELLAGHHVILGTPTGSGKSLVAAGLHFLAMCLDLRSFYTSPTKALASEKFFALCDEFGAENVGMLTGDVAINREAGIICCTAEILANLVLRQGRHEAPPFVVMDEFHFYADPERGVAWQVPLLALPDSQFLLMSATLGDMTDIARRLEDETGREVVDITHAERPVPLDFEYRETPIHETVEYLRDQRKVPVYVVNFTHRECAELAQALTSVNVCDKPEKERLADRLADARFDTPYGAELRRLLRVGIAVHHAGLLPKYRLLVEQLAQQGLLKVICGTDTLGVGVNIPIRTVLFARLAKFDGRKVAVLRPRDFRQIAGRAGRKGFDDRGSVVCQAPEHVIEQRRQALRAAAGGKKRAPVKVPKGAIVWNKQTFEQLIHRPPEKLVSRFRVTHGMILNCLQRPASPAEPGGYAAMVDLIARCHEDAAARPRLLREAAMLFRSLRRAGLVSLGFDHETGRPIVVVSPDLQADFSLFETLSLYLVDAVAALGHDAPDYALDVLTLVEAILEDPRPILAAQEHRAKGELVARLKAEGVPYEERMAILDNVTHPQPCADYIHATFDAFAARHPWVTEDDIHPKSIAREMFEGYVSFVDYVRRYGLQRSEGLLLRHLSQAYKTLVQTVPDYEKSDDVYDIQFFLRTLLRRVDSSLVEEWERKLAFEAGPEVVGAPPEREVYDLARDGRAFAARVRAEMHSLVRALAAGDFEEAARCVRANPEDPWDAARFERSLEPFLATYERLVFEPRTRRAEHTLIRQTDSRRWSVRQVLVDPAGENTWFIAGFIDLTGETSPDTPLVTVYDIGS